MSKKCCSVSNCSYTGKENLGISFHRFPSNQNKCSQWVKLTQNQVLINSFKENGPNSVKFKVICSAHFKNEDYSIWHGVGNRMLLYKGAIPSINLPTSGFHQLSQHPIWRPKVLSPLLKKILTNMNVDGIPTQGKTPKVLSPKVNKMLSNLCENYDNGKEQLKDNYNSNSSTDDSERKILSCQKLIVFKTILYTNLILYSIRPQQL